MTTASGSVSPWYVFMFFVGTVAAECVLANHSAYAHASPTHVSYRTHQLCWLLIMVALCTNPHLQLWAPPFSALMHRHDHTDGAEKLRVPSTRLLQ